jgi:hypothetical protein
MHPFVLGCLYCCSVVGGLSRGSKKVQVLPGRNSSPCKSVIALEWPCVSLFGGGSSLERAKFLMCHADPPMSPWWKCRLIQEFLAETHVDLNKKHQIDRNSKFSKAKSDCTGFYKKLKFHFGTKFSANEASPEIENRSFHILMKKWKNTMKLFTCELGFKKINEFLLEKTLKKWIPKSPPCSLYCSHKHIPTITSTSTRMHGEFLRLLVLLAHQETRRGMNKKKFTP